MKLLSVAVPCYNSQDYMRHCVETLLTGGEEIEILIRTRHWAYRQNAREP